MFNSLCKRVPKTSKKIGEDGAGQGLRRFRGDPARLPGATAFMEPVGEESRGADRPLEDRVNEGRVGPASPFGVRGGSSLPGCPCGGASSGLRAAGYLMAFRWPDEASLRAWDLARYSLEASISCMRAIFFCWAGSIRTKQNPA